MPTISQTIERAAATERKRRERERKRRAGLVMVTVWVRSEDRSKVHDHACQLNSNEINDLSVPLSVPEETDKAFL